MDSFGLAARLLGLGLAVSVEEILMNFWGCCHLGAKRQGTAEITLQCRVFDLRLSSKSDDAVEGSRTPP